MRIPPEGIEVGDSLTQEEIEEAFNTGFGYRISGINPRRDEHDRRYILLFANEDGPYDDSVIKGRFEYIGEGLTGDQSEDSPGNSALIDARTSDIPIPFFYKRAAEADWEYQGLVDVIDYEFQEQDGREVLVFTLEHQQHSEGEKGSAETETSHLNEYPDAGETFRAEIDRISRAGNGIIETEDGRINIGPVTGDAVGKEINAKMDDGSFARCLTKAVRVDNYETRYEMLKPPVNKSSSPFCSQCGSLMYPSEGGSRVCSSCGYKESGHTDENDTEVDSDVTEDITEKENDSELVKEGGSTKAHQSSKNSSSSKRRETTPIDSEGDTDTSKLRKKAIESAVEEVSEEASTVRHTTPTYNRSEAVKEYVKARADGVCEGCGKPAPFTSKTGEPYLHAHHVHELSDGGSDTPDTVIALCPNCHYRVHHGKDGDEYNEELLEMVQEKEHTGQ